MLHLIQKWIIYTKLPESCCQSNNRLRCYPWTVNPTGKYVFKLVLETLDCCNEIDSLTQLNSFPANDSYLKQLITWVFWCFPKVQKGRLALKRLTNKNNILQLIKIRCMVQDYKSLIPSYTKIILKRNSLSIWANWFLELNSKIFPRKFFFQKLILKIKSLRYYWHSVFLR